MAEKVCCKCDQPYGKSRIASEYATGSVKVSEEREEMRRQDFLEQGDRSLLENERLNA